MFDVFVSYRREDRPEAARLVAELFEEYFGADRVFFDRNPEPLEPGAKWAEEIEKAARGCKVLVAVIGPAWSRILAQRRTVPGTDWVVREIQRALASGAKVIPLLRPDVQGQALLPREEDLPDAISSLLEHNVHELRPDAGRDEDLRLLLASVRRGVWAAGRDRNPPPPFPLPPRGTPDVDSAAIPGDPSRGEPWSRELDDPHSADYKLMVRDPDVRRQIRAFVLGAVQAGASNGLSLLMAEQVGLRRKFMHSSKKRGLFLQASCVVTSPGDREKGRRFLLAIRSADQVHLEHEPRHVKGESVLIGTVLSSFGHHDDYGHVPRVLFNTLKHFDPWALFSRKLLLPAPEVHARFLGLGYNFHDPDKEYVHFVWHVESPLQPHAMLVPARDKTAEGEKAHDIATWVEQDKLETLDFEKARIDRAVLRDAFGLALPLGKAPCPEVAGFLPYAAFERVRHLDAPQPFRRDTVALDVLNEYRETVQRRAMRTPDLSTAEGVLRDFQVFLLGLASARQVNLSLEPAVAAPRMGGARRPVCVLEVRIGSSGEVRRYLVATEIGEQDIDVARDLDEWRDAVLGDFSGFQAVPRPNAIEAVFVLRVVPDGGRYACRREVSTVEGGVPIHVVRVADRDPSAPPTLKRVSHAVIPLRDETGAATAVLVTRSSRDESPRLPGGKLDPGESPRDSLLRELEEELLLVRPGGEEVPFQRDWVLDAQPLLDAGTKAGGPTHEFEGSSPSSREWTRYEFYAYLVRLDVPAVAHLRERLEGGDPELLVVGLEDWRRTGLGFDRRYVETVARLLDLERVEDFAIDLGRPGGGG